MEEPLPSSCFRKGMHVCTTQELESVLCFAVGGMHVPVLTLWEPLPNMQPRLEPPPEDPCAHPSQASSSRATPARTHRAVFPLLFSLKVQT